MRADYFKRRINFEQSLVVYTNFSSWHKNIARNISWCGDNKQYSQTEQEQNKHGPLQNLAVGSGAMEEWAFSADQ